ncbi:phosphoribosyltransferase-like protein [Bacillus cereus group sp. MYBK132-2]|uniref:phosphoribosyltransferase-like protein n=1 Tax=Bacillus cereus group TaxID=86661 RepID=UPI0037D28AB9
MLDINRLNRLTKIFEDQKWDISEKNNKLYDRFSKLLELLLPEDQDFILNLTEYYRCYGIECYEEMLLESLELMNKHSKEFFESETPRKVLVAPLLEYNNNNKTTKSSNLMCYLMKSNQLSYLEFLGDIEVEVLTFLDKSDIDRINDENYILILVDDYIGSGQTAKRSVNSYLEQGIDKDDIVVISLIIEKTGKGILDNLGVRYFHSSKKVYTLSEIVDNEDKARQSINRIAKKIKATKSYKAGFNSGGALVSMIRTPNNTLPFYWWERKYKAPFPRFKE